MPERLTLFVYGTLMRGQPNAHLLASSLYLGEARTAPRYTLVDLGAWPGLVVGGQQQILGERYEVLPAALAALDAFEEVPESYLRLPIALDPPTEAEAYVLREVPDTRRIVASGDWRAYAAASGQGGVR